MYKLVKISLIIGLILIGFTFLLFTMDELIYDYRANSFLEIMFSILFLFIIYFGVIFNFQSLKNFTPKESIETIDTPELPENKDTQYKKSVKNKICLLNNTFVLFLLLGVTISLYNIVFEENKNDEEYIYLVIAWFIIVIITILDIIAIRLDYIKMKRAKSNFELYE